MPYKSDSQRRWAHTAKGEKALGGPEGVNEWDQASKGKKLPEKVKKMADGGIIEEREGRKMPVKPIENTEEALGTIAPHTPLSIAKILETIRKSPIKANLQPGKVGVQYTQRFAEGGLVQDWKQHLKDYMDKNFGQPTHEMGSNLEGFQNLMKQQHPEPQSSTDTAKGYAYGGMPGEEDKMGLPPVQPQVPPIQFNPQAGLPPTPPMAPQMPVQAPNPVNQYLDQQKAQLNKFGPEQQLAISQDLIKQRQSLPQKGAVALGGIADALTRVGGGQSNYGGQIQEQQNKLAGEQVGALEKAGTQNIARTEANQKLDAMDPRSELSKVAQKTWGPLLAQNGFKPDQIMNMPASSIAALTGQSVEALKAKAEAEMARATLGLNTQKAGEDIRHNVAGENLNKTGEVLKAGEELRAHPIQRMLGILPGQTGLQNIMQGESPNNSEHQTAIQWAQANPTDDRAKRILKLHGL